MGGFFWADFPASAQFKFCPSFAVGSCTDPPFLGGTCGVPCGDSNREDKSLSVATCWLLLVICVEFPIWLAAPWPYRPSLLPTVFFEVMRVLARTGVFLCVAAPHSCDVDVLSATD